MVAFEVMGTDNGFVFKVNALVAIGSDDRFGADSVVLDASIHGHSPGFFGQWKRNFCYFEPMQ